MTEKPIVSVRNFAADRAICEAATEGPWTADGSYVEIPDDFYVGERGPLAYGGVEGGDENATFIAEARTGWPAALDRIAELEAVVHRIATFKPENFTSDKRMIAELQRLAKEASANDAR
ncbi:hypothetical protein [Paenibacillus pinihumi]|uniref:hypothetical protein n=1 Tax=Paenibacillus pinihumi TaxID=669462 RepID=UPI0004294812|nr:hypothetical protein [Paenibacillus pinihumi]